MKKLQWIFVVLCSLLTLAIGYCYMHKPIDTNWNISDDVKKAYLSTCKISIEAEGGLGMYTSSGVLLDTGYILTAAHCVDVNRDGQITGNEREPTIQFYGSNSRVIKGRVVFLSHYRIVDLAVIEIENPPDTGVKLGRCKFGERLFTIGMTKGDTPNISEGRASYPVDGSARASIPVWKGNSGGGVWNEKQELMGVASRMGVGSLGSSRFPLSNWMWYVDIDEIHMALSMKKLEFIYEPQEPESYKTVYIIYLLTSLQVLAVVASAVTAKKFLC